MDLLQSLKITSYLEVIKLYKSRIFLIFACWWKDPYSYKYLQIRILKARNINSSYESGFGSGTLVGRQLMLLHDKLHISPIFWCKNILFHLIIIASRIAACWLIFCLLPLLGIHVFGPPGSGSTSQRYGSGSGSIPFSINVLSDLKKGLPKYNFNTKW